MIAKDSEGTQMRAMHIDREVLPIRVNSVARPKSMPMRMKIQKRKFVLCIWQPVSNYRYIEAKIDKKDAHENLAIAEDDR